MNRKSTCLLLVVFLSVTSHTAFAEPISTSELSPYNALVFGDYDANASDVEGNAAIGGDLSLTDYSFGFQLDANEAAGTDVLVLGGDANLTRTRVYFGDFVHSGSNSLTNTGVDGVIRQSQRPPFEDLQDQYKAFSKSLSQLPLTGTTASQFNRLKLTGDPVRDVNVFSVTPSDWVDSGGADITVIELDISEGSTAIINVSGAVPEVSALGFEGVIDGAPSPHRHQTLFNFFEAESIVTRNIGLEGALLAPLAELNHRDAVIYGQVIAGSFQGNGQIDLEPFAGRLPFSVPEPVALPVWFLLLLFALRSRRGNS